MSDKVDIQPLKRALLVGFYLKKEEEQGGEESLEELARLAETYGFDVIDRTLVFLRKISAKTVIGSGKVEELYALSEEFNIELILFDEELSPHQQRNLEKVLKRPVLDRTELILEVFAQHAHTREARLQIELAKIRYQLPRLTRLWTHLSRQAGGGAYLRGVGEKQIELDRRMLRQRMSRLEKEIEKIRAHRKTQRRSRKRMGIPTFAIVGYTNAGKSTLLNALTAADVLIEDKLFATLDTTTRKFFLPNNQKILLVDTVGFIRKIPTLLIAAFKSTLEEAIHTDVLIHLIDASVEKAIEQAETTLEVLSQLGGEERPKIVVFNKVDACVDRKIIQKLRITYPKTVEISAVKREGFDDLLFAMQEAIGGLSKRVFLKIPQSHYGLVSELMREGNVQSIEYEECDILLDIEIPSELYHKVSNYEFS